MAKSANQKLKLLYLIKIFSENTDEHHSLTMPEIISRLKVHDISADRKTLYSDLQDLKDFGVDIISERVGRNTYYKLVGRQFELAELKLLVDSVQAAKFITDKKSHELIRKIEALTSVHEAKQLQRQVVITGRVKTENTAVFYNVDRLHEAITGNHQITFQYFQWNVKKERVLRHDGALYHVSPWRLVWDDEYYYLVAYDPGKEAIKHFRVDKMLNITLTEEEREGKKIFEKLDQAKYSRSLFGMYSGDEVSVSLEARNEMAPMLIDRFGKDITLIPKGKDCFTTYVDVMLSRQFLGWIMALGDGIRITGPEKAVLWMKAEVERLKRDYT